MRRYGTRLISVILLCMLLCIGFSPAAAASERRIVRVGYPIQAGFTEKDENGNYFGYTCEYLDEIAQYTGWEYEFVEVEGDLNTSLTTLLNMLMRGEIDLMGGMTYSDSLAEQMDFAGQSYGRAYTVLKTLYDNPDIVKDDYESMQGMRVATTSGALKRQAELAQFCEANGITYELVFCDNEEDDLAPLRDGRADVLLDVDVNLDSMDNARTVARFSPRPFYFATTKGNAELVQEINQAITTIDRVDPYFSSGLYDYYFGNQETELLFSDEETAYLRSAGTLRVGFSLDAPPFQYADPDTGEPMGIARDLMDYIVQQTGLRFDLVPTDTQGELEELSLNGQVDLVAGITYDPGRARRLDLSMTRPYITSPYVLILGPNTSEVALEDQRLTLPATLAGIEEFSTALVCDDLGQCLDAILSGKADYTYGNGYSAQYYVNQSRYRNLRLIPQTGSTIRMCIGVSRNADPLLLTILNKVVVNLSDDDLQSIIYQNTIYHQDYSLRAMVEANPSVWLIAVLLAALFIISVLGGILVIRIRRGKRDALDLQKHYQLYALSNEHFFEYDFRDESLLIANPDAAPGSRAEVRRRRRGDPGLSLADQMSVDRFLDLLPTLEDGVRDLHLPVREGEEGRWLRLTTQRVVDESGAPVYVVGKFVDINEEKQAQEALADKARRDGLTGLYNPVASRALITEALAAPDAAGGALFILDIDYFKEVNDLYGHYTGDLVLQRLSAVLQTVFRREDVVGRLGGDEFMVYVDHACDRDTAERRCTDILERVRTLVIPEHGNITISIGVALASPGMEYDALYKQADAALYEAKNTGRDRFRIA